MPEPVIVPVANYHCQVGENPLWNDQDDRIYWVDIDSGRLFRADHATLDHECFYQGDVVGGFTFQEDGTILLFEANRIVVFDPESKKRRVLCENIDPDMSRFNDVIADPEGRVFAGTVGRTDEGGGLYRVDRDGSVHCLWKGTGCANGMAFSRNLQKFYWTCSTSRRIYITDYQRETGALSNRKLFYSVPAEEGVPDGMTIDAWDEIWTARWDGRALLRMTPDAQVVERIEFPVAKISSVTFGGPGLDTLYVTTAGGSPGSETADGTLYRLRTRARGRPEYRSRIGI
jgi:D-xylonolactonase